MDDRELRHESTIVFVHGSVKPRKNEPWAMVSVILLNPCDGYHHAFACFDEDGEFMGFYDFADPTPYPEEDFYIAWAMLPDEDPLIAQFDPERAVRAAAAMEGGSE